ncbi:MAG TPA: CYTH and CHAD domain-containing protein [Rhizobacter sp.]|nr:CYTH and CHAD domain-containing protein [Rhizobacter sp.]
MNELELKFRLDDAASLRWQQMFEAQGARRQRLRARYFDTEDSRLAAAGVALRLRLEGRRWVQTLKATGESTVHRLEHEVAVQAAPGDTPALDLARHAGTPALARLQQALGDAAPQALIERFATDVWRASLVIEGADGSRIEAALDLGHVHAGGRQAPIAELELEHLAGPLATLFDRAHDALGAGGLWLSSISKAEQGERLRRGSPSPALEAQAVTWPKQASGAVMLRALLLNTLAQVLPNLSVTAEGQADAEHIHQARVGLRRLRTLLRELATASPGFDTRWDATLGEAFSALGERRDHEAVAAAVRPLLETAGAPKTTWTLPPTADTTAAARAPALQQVLLQLLALAHADDSAVSALSAKALTALFAKRLSRLHRQVRRDGRAFDSLPLARQHRVRRRLKRLRYLSEFAQPLWRGDKAGAYAEALKPMQDALGQHTDCAVAAEHFRHDALTDPAAQFAAGFLLAHLETTARNAHLALRRMRKLKPFWDD